MEPATIDRAIREAVLKIQVKPWLERAILDSFEGRSFTEEAEVLDLRGWTPYAIANTGATLFVEGAITDRRIRSPTSPYDRVHRFFDSLAEATYDPEMPIPEGAYVEAWKRTLSDPKAPTEIVDIVAHESRGSARYIPYMDLAGVVYDQLNVLMHSKR